MKSKTQKMITAAILIALGVLLPQIFHLIGGPNLGGILLPMHIPVLLTGFIVGPFYGIIAGLLTPVLSSLLTGMPPVSPPILFLMMFELPIYGLVAGFLFERKRANVFVSLIGAMILGRLSYGLGIIVLSKIFMLNIPAAIGVGSAFVSGLPGIALQIVLIPLTVKILEKRGFLNEGYRKS
ncbi:MAG: ECF transporter S component [Thermotogota bacterium]